jgi:hypothetical protein
MLQPASKRLKPTNTMYVDDETSAINHGIESIALDDLPHTKHAAVQSSSSDCESRCSSSCSSDHSADVDDSSDDDGSDFYVGLSVEMELAVRNKLANYTKDLITKWLKHRVAATNYVSAMSDGSKSAVDSDTTAAVTEVSQDKCSHQVRMYSIPTLLLRVDNTRSFHRICAVALSMQAHVKQRNCRMTHPL